MEAGKTGRFPGNVFITVLLFAAAFLCGQLAARVREQASAETALVFSEGSWGLSFQEKGKHQWATQVSRSWKATMLIT